ncbi:HtaA domain-containing protein [Streptosporangium sp. NPDC002607]
MTERATVVAIDMELIPTSRAQASILAWGVKPSFLRYVAGVGGVITIEDGAIELDGGFGFPLTGGREDGTVAARGTVRIRAHAGLLDVVLRDPGLQPLSGGEVLIASGADRTPRVLGVASTLNLALPETAPLFLHADAVPLFGDTYPAATEFDPVRFFRRRGRDGIASAPPQS